MVILLADDDRDSALDVLAAVIRHCDPAYPHLMHIRLGGSYVCLPDGCEPATYELLVERTDRLHATEAITDRSGDVEGVIADLMVTLRAELLELLVAAQLEGEANVRRAVTAIGLAAANR